MGYNAPSVKQVPPVKQYPSFRLNEWLATPAARFEVANQHKQAIVGSIIKVVGKLLYEVLGTQGLPNTTLCTRRTVDTQIPL